MRLTGRSEFVVNADHRMATYYYPKPDGTVWFSQYSEAAAPDGMSVHGCGLLTGEHAEELRKQHPDWFGPSGTQI